MPTRIEDYTVGWICAVETERVVACEFLDEEYTKDHEPQIDSSRDHNIYTFGRIHKHKVVIVGLPQGRYGISSATRVAEHMQSSFPALRLSLMVGIAGGVPSHEHDIRLGDVVVSCPSRKHCGVINYNFGIAAQQREFEETGHLASPSNILLSAVAALKARYKRGGHNISNTIAGMLGNNRRLRAEYSRPGTRMDRLYKSNYIHSDQKVCDCQIMLKNKDEIDLDGNPYLIQRLPRDPDEDDPAIPHGLIASADRLVKDAILRDTLAEKHDVLCFEMEAAGLMNSDLRCLVIRGVCDYADTHKNDTWQGYAAATSAAYAKELLELIPCSLAQSTAAEKCMLPVSRAADNPSPNMQGPADINIGIGPTDSQQSLIHPVQGDLNVNVFLTGIRNIFMKSPEASQDTGINICIEIARHSDQLKTFARVQQVDSTENQQKEDETDQDQVFLNCISICKKRKPSEAAEDLSRSFSGSTDFSFERGNNFYSEQYSVNQTFQDRMVFVASKETYISNGYSIELFLRYIVKRRRWQRVHVYITAMDKIGDLANIPISGYHWSGQLTIWTPPQSFVLMLESVLQDLELTGSVTRVDLPLYQDDSYTLQYNFESVQANEDYGQKDLLDRVDADATRYLQNMGCMQYRESQLSILKRLQPDKFLVTDGSSEYFLFVVPFARTVWDKSEIQLFVEAMMKAQALSSCQGVSRFIGVLLDDHRDCIKGYLTESRLASLAYVLSVAESRKYTIPQALRRLWARQLITSVSEIHSKEALMETPNVSISHSLNIVQELIQWVPTQLGAFYPPELTPGKDLLSQDIGLAQKSDIFLLGYELWKLSEHVLKLFRKRYLCVMVGCTTRPYYRCLDEKHLNPVSLPFSQNGDPVLREIIKKCRMEDPNKRPSAQELAYEITKETSFEEDEIEISRQKIALRALITNIPAQFTSCYCDECMTPLFNGWFRCNICNGCRTETICGFIASALIMDALPPGSHTFHPEALFQTLYSAIVDGALRVYFHHNPTLVTQHFQCIKAAFISFAFEIYKSAAPASQLRADKIREASFVWINLKTNRTCLLCLAKSPEHSLTCGHTICDDCMRLFATAVPQLEHHYVLQYCNLCETKGYIYARLRPPTAGIRMLTVDGGGICGVIPLQFLSMLQDNLGTHLAIQDLFDAAFGTSAGGLIVLGLFVQGWDVRTCTKKFTNLGQQLFATKGRASWQILSKLGDIFWCLLSDGHYDVQMLDSLLQGNFGKDSTLFGANHRLVSGLKVGVTATTTSSASACLFANYNGLHSRGGDSCYKFVQGSLDHEPRVWEAARATSAAPVLFTPVHIPTVGSFQDGGLRHNNPIRVALSEVKQIWPQEVTPDFVLSLGTGKEAESPTSTSPLRSRFRDGFVPRLVRSLVYSLNTENPWRELMNHLDDATKNSYVRLNIPFQLGEKIRLDDTSKIEYLMSSVREQKGSVQQQQSIILSLLASCFYFELKKRPHFQRGCFEVSGFLRCRADARKILTTLHKFSSSVQVVTDLASFGQLDETSICSACHRLTKPLAFQVNSITDTIKIELATQDGDRRQISGSPNSMQWYVKQQQLDFSFGSQSRSPEDRNCSSCNIPQTPNPFMQSIRSEIRPKRYKLETGTYSRKRQKAC